MYTRSIITRSFPMLNDTLNEAASKVENTPEQPQSNTQSMSTHNSAGMLVLQWLTYAFWGWLILGLIWLMGVILANALLDESSTEMIPYAIAASVVLLPLAFVTDFFYRKHEPLKKVGGAAIIMVVHTVLFALLGIIALIVTIFTTLSIVISTNRIEDQLVAIFTTGFATILYAGAFIRTLNPFKNTKPLFIYSLIMVGLTVVLLGFATFGPFAKSLATRNDRLIEQNLPSLVSDITAYAKENDQLPASLEDINTSGETQQLIDSDLVEYKKEETVEPTKTSGLSAQYRYQLCVTYASSRGSRYTTRDQSNEEYNQYISGSNHDAGRTCYKLQVTTYSYEVLNKREEK